jgi:hypothetical protein
MRRQEDIDFAIRLSFKGGHFIGISEPVLTQLATTGDEKSARNEYESFLKILKKNELYLKKKLLYNYMLLWSEMRYKHFSGQDIMATLALIRLLMLYPLRTLRHFWLSAFSRFCHERRIKAKFASIK